ncbi:type II secretion system F family protein [Clostridium sp. LIBA-8841]|uniref:type II secretion system F family protein n=1 Tax=Clostridium sp. LIBA-8841 TaxID=2987530 RepID=UPI002AC3D4BD|nr:type II secretion system F family protein [Clostridium sp. LIBA-8841]MDZ5252787.1 type II secretion system F family protein [Clostridium sp. LIBA-8841]
MFGFKDDASYICLNLSTYVKSGMPIGRSLELIKGTVRDKKYKESIERVEKKVLKGESLSKAFKEERNLYPDIMVDMIKIGEESGNLEEVLEKCAKNILAEKEVENKVIKSLRYPVSLLIGLLLMIFCYATYILPQFVDMYDLGDKETSKLISVLNSYIRFIEDNHNVEVIAFCYFLCILIAGYLIFKIINFEKMLEKVEIYRMYYEIRILFLINMIITSGISLTNALSIFGENLSNKKLREYVRKINEELLKGETLSNSIGSINVISHISKGFLITGEESGLFNKNIEELLKIREKDFDRTLNKTVGKIEPAMFIVLGFVISAMMLLVLIPTFEGMKYV